MKSIIHGGIMQATHLIGRLIRVGRSNILELPTDIAGFYFEKSLYFPIGDGRYASRKGFRNIEPDELEQLKLALPTASLLTRQLVWQEGALGLSVYQIEIMLAPVAIAPFHPVSLSGCAK